MVAWKEAVLAVEKRDARLLVPLALVSVFERTWIVCGGFADAVVPQSGQRYERVREARRVPTSPPSGMLLAGGEGGPCNSWG